MQYETTLVAQQHQKYGLPIRTATAGQPPAMPQPAALEVLAMRRNVRQGTDVLMKALFAGDPVQLLKSMCDAMHTISTACVQLGIEPALKDFVYAAKELLEDARIPFDKGLHVKEWDQAIVGVAMIEIVCAGVAYCLNMPYVQAFAIMHEGRMEQALPEQVRARLRGVLREAGYDIPEETASNDPSA